MRLPISQIACLSTTKLRVGSLPRFHFSAGHHSIFQRHRLARITEGLCRNLSTRGHERRQCFGATRESRCYTTSEDVRKRDESSQTNHETKVTSKSSSDKNQVVNLNLVRKVKDRSKDLIAAKNIRRTAQFLQSRKLKQGKRISNPASLAESREMLDSWQENSSKSNPKVVGQPYSVPEPELFDTMSQSQMRNRLRYQTYEEMPASTWFADRAAPPVLITFDAFDTLFTPRESIATQYTQIARMHGLEVNLAEIEASFKNVFKVMSDKHPNYGKADNISPETWWRTVIQDTFMPILTSDATLEKSLVDAIYHRFASSEGYTLFEDVASFLTDLGVSFQASRWPPRRTMLGIISNSDPRVRSILQSFGVGVLPAMFPPRFAPVDRHDSPDFGPANFSFATLSYECGISKPESGIFAKALDDAQTSLNTMHPVARLTRSGKDLLKTIDTDFHHMHVGDDIEKDVRPALQCGWDAVLIDRTAEDAISERTLADGLTITVINSLQNLRHLVTKERIAKKLELKSAIPSRVGPPRTTRSNKLSRSGRKTRVHPLNRDLGIESRDVRRIV